MLSFFRQKGLSNVLYGAIIVATILTFVIEFRPNASQRTASLSESCAARVRGRCLDPKDFGSAYRLLMPSRSAETSRRLNIKRVALDGLIERELLDDEAKRLGIGVTEDEVTDQLYAGYVRASVPSADPTVAQSILQEMYQSYARAGLVSQEVAQAHFNDRDTAIPVDFRDPKSKTFDMKVYERQVRNLSNRSTTEFRGEQTRELLAAKMRDVIRAPVRVSEAEAWEEYRRRYDTATVSWLPVKDSWVERWSGAAASAAEVDAWVKDHQQDVDKELADRQKAAEPKAGHLRHILVKLPYGATDDEKAAALAKLSWAVARVKAGESFAEVAREASDDKGQRGAGRRRRRQDRRVRPSVPGGRRCARTRTVDRRRRRDAVRVPLHHARRPREGLGDRRAGEARPRSFAVREGHVHRGGEAHRRADSGRDALRKDRGRRHARRRRGLRAPRRQARTPPRAARSGERRRRGPPGAKVASADGGAAPAIAAAPGEALRRERRPGSSPGPDLERLQPRRRPVPGSLAGGHDERRRVRVRRSGRRRARGAGAHARGVRRWSS